MNEETNLSCGIADNLSSYVTSCELSLCPQDIFL